MELGAKLKELREAHQLSQEAVALELGVSRQAVTKWESGQSNPSTANLMALCRLYSVSLDELAALETAPERPEEQAAASDGTKGSRALYIATALCLALCAVWTAVIQRRMAQSAAIIGGADGTTTIFVTQQRTPLDSLLMLILDPKFLYGATFVLAILCLRRLIARHKNRKNEP